MVVTNSNGQSGTKTSAFTYTAPAGGETELLADDFNDASLNTSKWLANNLFSGFTDPTVAVSETQALNVGPLKQNTDGSHYNGIRSLTADLMAGAIVAALNVALAVSFAALLFQGELRDGFAMGLWALLLSMVVTVGYHRA